MRRSTNRRSRTSWREVVEWRQPQVVCRWGDISLIVGPPRARGDEPFVPPPNCRHCTVPRSPTPESTALVRSSESRRRLLPQ